MSEQRPTEKIPLTIYLSADVAGRLKLAAEAPEAVGGRSGGRVARPASTAAADRRVQAEHRVLLSRASLVNGPEFVCHPARGRSLSLGDVQAWQTAGPLAREF